MEESSGFRKSWSNCDVLSRFDPAKETDANFYNRIRLERGQLWMNGQTLRSDSPLARLYQDYWEFFLAEFPTYSTYLGDHRYDDKLEDASETHFHTRVRKTRDFLDQLHNHAKPSNSAYRLNYELFERELTDKLEEAKFQPFLQPISQQDRKSVV